jgi:competence ComEA-like helix-hairpin-helix protein
VALYSRREIFVLFVVVVLGAAGIGIDRWRREHPELANRLEALDRTAAPATPPEPARFGTDHGNASRPRGAAQRATRAHRHNAEQVTPVDLNLASRDELQQLPGVGPGLAARIVQARERDGPFGSVDDLRRVRGVGRATLERLRPLLAVNTP